MKFEDDLLDREKYADFLTEIISNPQKYKRMGDSNSMTIAIDSSWGTGKTTFIDMWSEKLCKSFSDEFYVIKYNAWENDFIENPFESILYSFYNSLYFEEINSEEIAKEEIEAFKESAFNVLKAFGKFAVRKFAGEKLSDAVADLIDDTDKVVKKANGIKLSKEEYFSEKFVFYDEYNKYTSAIKELQNNINKLSQKRKIVIFIDELDRCKPTFSIRLLENVKHIFNVENLIFVFALDMEQLGYSIKNVYGQEMNANGYLCRFFDYISKMPKGRTENFFEKIETKSPLIEKVLYDKNGKKVKFTGIFQNMVNSFNLSLRDIDTIYTNFRIFEALELKTTTSIYAYSLYLFLIILKYSNLTLYNKIFLYHEDSQQLKNEISENDGFIKYLSINTINQIIRNNKIRNLDLELKYTSGEKEGTFKLLRVDNDKFYYSSKGENQFFPNEHYMEVKNIRTDINASELLFYDDIIKCNEIINKNIGDYIHEKLEIFNFEGKNNENKEQNLKNNQLLSV